MIANVKMKDPVILRLGLGKEGRLFLLESKESLARSIPFIVAI